MRRYVAHSLCLDKEDPSSQANIDIALLFEMCTDKRNKLQLDMYLSSTEGTNEGGSSDRVCELRMCWLCLKRLVGYDTVLATVLGKAIPEGAGYSEIDYSMGVWREENPIVGKNGDFWWFGVTMHIDRVLILEGGNVDPPNGRYGRLL